MILQHTVDGENVLFVPENTKDQRILKEFPGLIKEGVAHYCPSKQNVVYNLYTRMLRKTSIIKVTPDVKSMIDGNVSILELPEDFKFHTEPLMHQRIALRFAYTFGNFLNLSEPGLGKTKVTLDYIWLMRFCKTIIVCPKALLNVWIDETEKHRPELSVYIVESTDWTKEKDGISKADIVVVNYDKAVALEKQFISTKFDFIAVDEGLIKNPATERTKSLTRLGKSIKYRSVMSGTLVNNSPLDIFAPVRFVEPSLTGEAFGKFRDEYSIASQRNRFITIGYRYVSEVKDILGSCGIIMTKAEWLKSLPPKEFNRITVHMGDMQREYYHKLASNYLVNIEELNVEVEVDNPLVVMMKLNQISNGFLYYKEDISETIEEVLCESEKTSKKSKVKRETHYFQDQPKAEALITLISSDRFNSHDNATGCGTRSIIWYNLGAELDIISKVLDREGISYLVIKGGDKDLSAKIKTFNNNPKYQFLVCQSKTLNYGVTVMGNSGEKSELEDSEDCILPDFDPIVSDEIFYSLNFSLEIFLQQQDRIHRIGQKRKCKYWLLLTNSKVEQTIADRLESKLICNREVLVDIINSIGLDQSLFN